MYQIFDQANNFYYTTSNSNSAISWLYDKQQIFLKSDDTKHVILRCIKTEIGDEEVY